MAVGVIIETICSFAQPVAQTTQLHYREALAQMVPSGDESRDVA